MYNKTDRKVKSTIVKDYCTKLGTKQVWGWKHVHRKIFSVIYIRNIYIYIYIYYGEVYQDINESFCIIRSSFLMYIFTHYRQKWLVDIILYHHEVQICLKLTNLDFTFMLHYGQRITQVCFNSISMDSDYRNAVLMQCLCLWTANMALIFAVFFSWFLWPTMSRFILWWRHQHFLKLSLTV